MWIFIFISGSGNKGTAYDAFIKKICSNINFAFFRTILTWGYLKRSSKNCVRHHRLNFLPVPTAELGKPCPDAKLVDLNRNTKHLLADYVAQCGSILLILNMGSYT